MFVAANLRVQSYRSEGRETKLVPQERTEIRQVVYVEAWIDVNGGSDDVVPHFAACRRSVANISGLWTVPTHLVRFHWEQ